MSYILDALRKSEQQRQAVQPAKVTDRLLVVPSQPKGNSNQWLKGLLLFNLLLALSLVWFFLDKSKPEQNQTTAVNLNKESMKPGKLPVKEQDSPATGEYRRQLPSRSNLPALSQHDGLNKTADTQRSRPASAKKEALDKKAPTAKKNTFNQEALVQHSPNNRFPESYREEALPAKHKPVDVKELPYQERNNLPNMTINVFSYAQKAEDRFVIIDMVKYKPGQFIKGSVKLKEILEDSIVVEDGNKTFKVERP